MVSPGHFLDLPMPSESDVYDGRTIALAYERSIPVTLPVLPTPCVLHIATVISTMIRVTCIVRKKVDLGIYERATSTRYKVCVLRVTLKRWNWKFKCSNFFNFWRTKVLFVGPLIPVFWTSGKVSFRFRAWQRHMCYTFPEVHLWHNTCWLTF